MPSPNRLVDSSTQDRGQRPRSRSRDRQDSYDRKESLEGTIDLDDSDINQELVSVTKEAGSDPVGMETRFSPDAMFWQVNRSDNSAALF